MVVLVAGLVTGWGWDRARTAGMLCRSAESEQYFRQRLFESLGEKADESQQTQPPKPNPQN